MSDPPATESEGSSSITMQIDASLAVGESIISAVHRISGFSWRVRVTRVLEDCVFYRDYAISLLCDAPAECELWQCEATVKMASRPFRVLETDSYAYFGNWGWHSLDWEMGWMSVKKNDSSTTSLEVQISTDVNGESFTRGPSLQERSMAHDVVLVVEGQRISANKQVLASQSTYFNCLFFGGFKESDQQEIEIKDVDPEDFHQMLNMMYGGATKPTTEEKALKYLMMAEIFDLKIVRDRVENFFLSTHSIPLHRKLLIADQNRLETLKNDVLPWYRYGTHSDQLVARLHNSPEFGELSDEVMNVLFGYSFEVEGMSSDYLDSSSEDSDY